MHLIGNALKFTSKGEVVVRVELEADVADQPAFHFSVADTGIGNPARQAKTDL